MTEGTEGSANFDVLQLLEKYHPEALKTLRSADKDDLIRTVLLLEGLLIEARPYVGFANYVQVSVRPGHAKATLDSINQVLGGPDGGVVSVQPKAVEAAPAPSVPLSPYLH